MKYSLITATLIYKVDIRDYLGFVLNNAINKIIIDKRKKEIQKDV